MMRAFKSVGLFASNVPWTCRRCLQKQKKNISNEVSSVKRIIRGQGRKRKKGPVVLTAATGTLGAGALFFTDDMKHYYAASERTGRVVSTLALCINE